MSDFRFWTLVSDFPILDTDVWFVILDTRVRFPSLYTNVQFLILDTNFRFYTLFFFDLSKFLGYQYYLWQSDKSFFLLSCYLNRMSPWWYFKAKVAIFINWGRHWPCGNRSSFCLQNHFTSFQLHQVKKRNKELIINIRKLHIFECTSNSCNPSSDLSFL